MNRFLAWCRRAYAWAKVTVPRYRKVLAAVLTVVTPGALMGVLAVADVHIPAGVVAWVFAVAGLLAGVPVGLAPNRPGPGDLTGHLAEVVRAAVNTQEVVARAVNAASGVARVEAARREAGEERR